MRRTLIGVAVLLIGLIHIDGQCTSTRNDAHWTNGLYDLAPSLIPMLAHHIPSTDKEREWFSGMLLNKAFMVPGVPAVNDDYFVAACISIAQAQATFPLQRCYAANAVSSTTALASVQNWLGARSAAHTKTSAA
ncbi:hypothetical protein K438DRAFT_1979528 [Mycena galopus ATCC 62051]|nr:hypothetical protein K438DRAFT_1979528 [Mycena galopus ATCC 62051]